MIFSGVVEVIVSNFSHSVSDKLPVDNGNRNEHVLWSSFDDFGIITCKYSGDIDRPMEEISITRSKQSVNTSDMSSVQKKERKYSCFKLPNLQHGNNCDAKNAKPDL